VLDVLASDMQCTQQSPLVMLTTATTAVQATMRQNKQFVVWLDKQASNASLLYEQTLQTHTDNMLAIDSYTEKSFMHLHAYSKMCDFTSTEALPSTAQEPDFRRSSCPAALGTICCPPVSSPLCSAATSSCLE